MNKNKLLPNYLLWNFEELHKRLLNNIEKAFYTLKSHKDYADKIQNEWKDGHWKPKGKIAVSQGCLLGTGGGDERKNGGLWSFATEYAEEKLNCDKIRAEKIANDIRHYDRYNDFQLYTYIEKEGKKHPWYEGKKRLILIIEAENNPDELKGEFVGLLQVRCPYKYLFIKKSNVKDEINEFCREPNLYINEVPETHLFISEIPPDSKKPPSEWKYYHAEADMDGNLYFTEI